MRNVVAVMGAVALAALGALGCSDDGGDRPTVKVGVLLPLTGPEARHSEEPLAWARDEINRAGGIRGRRLELVFQDTGAIPSQALDGPRRVWELAKTFLGDPSVDVVIGTDSDETTFGIAPAFIKTKKLLIAPAASSGRLSQAFGQSRFVRRTIATDAARAELMILLAKRVGAQSISLLATTAFGSSTFFDWIPYHAEQIGLTVNHALRMNRGEADCRSAMLQIYTHETPQVLFLIPDNTAQAECMVRQARALLPDTRLFMDDPVRFAGLWEALGPLAEGIIGISSETPQVPAAGPGFADAYRAALDHAPPPFAAQLFDAVALAAYTLVRANGAKGDALATAFDEVVRGKGELTAWNGDGMARAFRLIDAGGVLPDVTGATGGLTYAERFPLEPTSATFALWQVRSGIQQWGAIELGDKKITAPENFLSLDGHQTPLDLVPEMALRSVAVDEETGYVPAPRKGGWAFVAAMSSTMDNYRHQADALNMYQWLKTRGWKDDRIVLILADDVVTAATNPEPGVVRNLPDGPNVRMGDVQIDYRPADVTPAAVLDILAGRKTGKTPVVVDSTANDDVFVYWIGHGGSTGVLVGDSAEAGEASQGQFITPFALADAVRTKFEAHGFRKMVIALDSCHAGVMGAALATPGVVLFTGAAPNENSYAANYGAATNIWYADAFSSALTGRLAAAPDSSIVKLYEDTYVTVRGSHPRLYNGGKFGQASTVTIGSILAP